MNIEQAINHFEYKLKNHWKPTKKDVEAYNSLIDYKEQQESASLSENEALAKLFIHQFILLCQTKIMTSEMALKSINDILSKSVYEWCLILKEEIPMLRFNSIGVHKYPLDEKDFYNVTKMQERNKLIINEFETELTEALRLDVEIDDVVKFVEKNINRIIKY